MDHVIWDERDFNGSRKIMFVIFIFISIIQLLGLFHTKLHNGEYELVSAPRFYEKDRCFINFKSEWWTIEIVSGISVENIEYAGECVKYDNNGKQVKSEAAGVCIVSNGAYKFKTGTKKYCYKDLFWAYSGNFLDFIFNIPMVILFNEVIAIIKSFFITLVLAIIIVFVRTMINLKESFKSL